jgi:hypothetical protein
MSFFEGISFQNDSNAVNFVYNSKYVKLFVVKIKSQISYLEYMQGIKKWNCNINIHLIAVAVVSLVDAFLHQVLWQV